MVKLIQGMPTIQINLDYFINLGNLPFPMMLARLFLDGGWIIFLAVLIKGGWMLWVQWRQEKYATGLSHTILAIDIPRQNEQTAKAVEQIFSHIAGAYSGLDNYEKYWLGKFQGTFSFEIASLGGYVQFFVHCQNKYRDLVESAFYAQYPDAEIVEVTDYTGEVPSRFPDEDWDLFGTEFILKRPSHLPIRTHIQFEHSIAEDPFKDPMSGMLEVMSSLKPGEHLWLQFLITPTDTGWRDKGEVEVAKMAGRKKAPKKSVVQSVIEMPMQAVQELTGIGASAEPTKDSGKSTDLLLTLTPGERQVLEAIQFKLSKIGFETKIRMVYSGRRGVFSKGRVTMLKGAMGQFTALNMNEFKGYGPVTTKTDYFYQRWTNPSKQMTILRNYRKRSRAGATPYILNIEELATVYHFPVWQVKAPLVKKTEAKRSEPPPRLPTAEAEQERPFRPVTPPAPPPEEEEEERPPGGPPEDLPFA